MHYFFKKTSLTICTLTCATAINAQSCELPSCFILSRPFMKVFRRWTYLLSSRVFNKFLFIMLIHQEVYSTSEGALAPASFRITVNKTPHITPFIVS